ncbi:hypothetical protein [Pseudomonas fluorescens]|uniref:hypothetical protein n=1 Tax=Pseudomonas fluorescens TaxID=294 RepID=UPI002B1E58CB|nr:hypothetical protein [Pseudomonas fluorescens]
MRRRPSMDEISGTFGIECVVGLDPSKSLDEVSAVNQNRCGHAFFLKTKTPKGL